MSFRVGDQLQRKYHLMAGQIALAVLATSGCKRESEVKSRPTETKLVCSVTSEIYVNKQHDSRKGKLYLVITEYPEMPPDFNSVGGIANITFWPAEGMPGVEDRSTKDKWDFTKEGQKGTLSEGRLEMFSLNRVSGELFYRNKEARGLLEVVVGLCEKSVSDDWKKF